MQGEHALAKLSHGDVSGETLEQIYDRPGAFLRPYIKNEELPGGADQPVPGEDQKESNP